MNRLVLIGNGFDLAHGLKTSYANFINWYKEHRIELLGKEHSNISSDPLCTIELLRHQALSIFVSNLRWENYNVTHLEIFDYIVQNTDDFKVTFSPLYERIIKGLESKTWAGIEQDYYDLLKEYAFRDSTVNPNEPPIKALNQQLRCLQEWLVEYLTEVCSQKPDKIASIEDAIYAPINTADISVAGQKFMQEHVDYWRKQGHAPLEKRKELFGINNDIDINSIINKTLTENFNGDYPLLLRLPNNIMFLNFNYTDTSSLYFKKGIVTIDYIHGHLEKPESIIFGYGDELDDKFKELKAHKNNACLSHVKSIRYLEAPNYRQMLSFIESEPFQVLIMGHSCGNSDRTLLNTIFEHPNCVSIKPYYYVTDKEKKTDNYIELVQHISRNFNDMKLMRDRVVNKTQCKPLAEE